MRQRKFRSEVPLDVVTIIGSQAEIGVGRIRVHQDLRIDGKVQATIVADGRLVIGPHGQVRGDISAREMIVGGYVSGTILVEGSLTLQSTAIVEGRIVASRMTVEDGAAGSFQATIGLTPAVEAAERSLTLSLFDENSSSYAGDGAVEAGSLELETLSVKPSESDAASGPLKPPESGSSPDQPDPKNSAETPRLNDEQLSRGTDRFW